MAVGPPRVGVPIAIGRWVFTPSSGRSFTVPIGTCHTSFLLPRSMALMVPNGGVMQGTPSGDCSTSIFTPP